MTSEADFWAALRRRRADHQTRLVFADWLQERDDDRSEGMRAMGLLRCYPVRRNHGHPAKPHWVYEIWAGGYATPRGPDDVPFPWFERVDLRCSTFANLKYDPDFITVESALARAFAILPPETRQNILKGVVA